MRLLEDIADIVRLGKAAFEQWLYPLQNAQGREEMDDGMNGFVLEFEAARPAYNEEGEIVLWITGDEDFPEPWIEEGTSC